jgi:hypothetical protein
MVNKSFSLLLFFSEVSRKDFILQGIIVNILTKLAILSSSEIKIPFSDPFMADSRKFQMIF